MGDGGHAFYSDQEPGAWVGDSVDGPKRVEMSRPATARATEDENRAPNRRFAALPKRVEMSLDAAGRSACATSVSLRSLADEKSIWFALIRLAFWRKLSAKMPLLDLNLKSWSLHADIRRLSSSHLPTRL